MLKPEAEDKINNVESITEDILHTITNYNKKFEYKIDRIDLNDEIDNKEWNNQMLFISFTNDGNVAVVGAGQNDIKIGKSKTKEMCDMSDETMSTVFLIIIPQRGIKEVTSNGKGAGIEGCNNILECRNGIEMYLGEKLLANNIKIINAQSHKNNYSEKYWKEREENKFGI